MEQKKLLAKTSIDLNNIKLIYGESPFQWKPEILEENFNEIEIEINEENKFSFQNFVVNIVNSYIQFQKNEFVKALKIIEDLEKHMEHLKNINYSDKLFNNISDALNHILLTCKSNTMIYNNDIENLDEVIQGIVLITNMNNSNKAALYAIRSNIESLYSFNGTHSAINHINIAISLDPDVPYWQFLKGTYLYKLRNLQNLNQAPLLEERELFINAFKKEENNPLFMVYVADIYRESAMRSFKGKDDYFCYLPNDKSKVNLVDRIERKFQQSLEYYRKSYELKPMCPLISFRCAYGLMTLPSKFQDLKLANKIIMANSSKFTNNGFGNLVIAMYYKEIEKNLAIARRHLQKCVELNVFKGCMNMILLEFLENGKNFDTIKALTEMLNKFHESHKQDIILTQIISFYTFVNFNMNNIYKYTIEYFKTRGQVNYIQIHQSCFVHTSGPISLIDVIVDKIKFILNDKGTTPEMRDLCREFMMKLSFENIEIAKSIPQNLREQILKNKIQRDIVAPQTANPHFKKQENIKNRRNIKNQENHRNNTGTINSSRKSKENVLPIKSLIAFDDNNKFKIKNKNITEREKIIPQKLFAASNNEREIKEKNKEEAAPIASKNPTKINEKNEQEKEAIIDTKEFFKKWKSYESKKRPTEENIHTNAVNLYPETKHTHNDKREGKTEQRIKVLPEKYKKGNISKDDLREEMRLSFDNREKSQNNDEFIRSAKYESKNDERHKKKQFHDELEENYSDRHYSRRHERESVKRNNFTENMSDFSEPRSRYSRSPGKRNRKLSSERRNRSHKSPFYEKRSNSSRSPSDFSESRSRYSRSPVRRNRKLSLERRNRSRKSPFYEKRRNSSRSPSDFSESRSRYSRSPVRRNRKLSLERRNRSRKSPFYEKRRNSSRSPSDFSESRSRYSRSPVRRNRKLSLERRNRSRKSPFYEKCRNSSRSSPVLSESRSKYSRSPGKRNRKLSLERRNRSHKLPFYEKHSNSSRSPDISEPRSRYSRSPMRRNRKLSSERKIKSRKSPSYEKRSDSSKSPSDFSEPRSRYSRSPVRRNRKLSPERKIKSRKSPSYEKRSDSSKSPSDFSEPRSRYSRSPVRRNRKLSTKPKIKSRRSPAHGKYRNSSKSSSDFSEPENRYSRSPSRRNDKLSSEGRIKSRDRGNRTCKSTEKPLSSSSNTKSLKDYKERFDMNRSPLRQRKEHGCLEENEKHSQSKKETDEEKEEKG